MVKHNDTATHHINKVIRTIADPTLSIQKAAPATDRRAQAVTPIVPPHPPKNGIYDIVVLGTGPAGLTAALFAARAGLSVLVFGSDSGSLSETNSLENFPSWQLQGGPLWLQTTKQQAAQWGATFAQAGLMIEKLYPPNDNNDTFELEVSGSLQTNARSVVVATGATGKRLGLGLEDALWGKSVHSCAVCDGSSYIDKTVVVVGGGDAAVDGALLLSRYAKQVIVVHRRTEFRASNSRNMELLKSTPNIQLEMPFTILKFETSLIKKPMKGADGTTKDIEERYLLTAVKLQDVNTQATKRIPCDGVFELIGSSPNTLWLKGSGADLDKEGFLVLSNPSGETRTATKMEGMFAAGEVTDQIYRQAITAAAEGAEAAMDAERWLRTHPAPGTPAKHNKKSIPLQTVLLQDKERELEPVGPTPPAPKDEDVCDLTQEECILKIVQKYPVVVFSKPWCPYCRKALEALAAEGLSEGNSNLHVVDLTTLGGKAKLVQGTLQSMTGRRTVPNVFVGGSSIGGGDETSKFHREGKLHGMLVDAKAIERTTAGKEASCDDLSQESCITQLVNQYPVVVFSKPTCPFCRRALEALAIEGLPQGNPKLFVVNLASKPNMSQIQDRLQAMTGRRTVPNVFVGGESIGGGSETVQLQQEGKLRGLLAKASAIASSR